MSVSIKDVANEAGVSVATVSRVMHGSHAISEETTKRVQKAIKHLAFVPKQTCPKLSQPAL